MSNRELNKYLEKPEDIDQAVTAALDYIYMGPLDEQETQVNAGDQVVADPQEGSADQPDQGEAVEDHPVFSLQGLCVYGVIAALREADKEFYGENSELDDAQRERLAEVEAAVDFAVERRMHYYPFGHDEDRFAIDYGLDGSREDRQRAGAYAYRRVGPVRGGASRQGKEGHRKRTIRKQRGEMGETHDEEL